MIQNPLTVNIAGVPWNLYGAEWAGADGRFGFYFYAISDEHAQLVLQEIKETAVLTGRIGGVIPATPTEDEE